MMRRGLTLVELLIGIALLVALSGAMYGFLYDILSSRTRINEMTERQRAATVLLQRVEESLMTCVVGGGPEGAGIVGDNNKLEILSRAVASDRAIHGVDDPQLFSDLQRTVFEFDPQQRTLSLAQNALMSGNVANTPTSILTNNISKVRFRFYYGKQWRDSFDSTVTGALPRAVEVAIWFDPWPGEEIDESTTNEDAVPQRLTFDSSAGFDERAFAEQSDLDLKIPAPDRIRIIAIPDARGRDR